MQQTIKQSQIVELPSEVINQIAAGEVIERPASVVKELVENSIDAKASEITVTIEDYGRKLIEVRDNGIGMTEKDISQCIKRHATSKISDYDDIFSIHSLGFRGEAIPSISSISNLEILSKTKNALEGIRAEISNETVSEITPAGLPVGTIIRVKDLFYNTPVRKKFLKADRTELSAISDKLQKIAIIYPHIEFNLIHNNKKMLSFKKNQCLKERIYEIFGRTFSDNNAEIIHEDSQMFLRGFIGAPIINKVNSTGILTFVNGRFIKDKTINHAITQSYKTFLMGGKYPQVLLSIEIDPSVVDINIHPTKSEVKFQNPKKLYDIIHSLILKKLSSHFWVELMDTSKEETPVEVSEEKIEKELKSTHDRIVQEKMIREKLEEFSSSFLKKPSDPAKKQTSTTQKPIQAEIAPIETQGFYSSLRVIGQFNSLYIVCEKDDKLYLIDHHAAHERIRFEKIKKEFETSGVKSQSLLVPLVLDLDKSKAGVLEKLTKPFLNIGIEFEHFGDQTFVVKRIPVIIPEDQTSAMILELIDRIIQEDELLNSKEIVWDSLLPTLYNLFSIMACHSAIRGRMKLEPIEISSLLRELDELEVRSNCPHGRPIIIDFTLNEIEKKFGRIQ